MLVAVARHLQIKIPFAARQLIKKLFMSYQVQSIHSFHIHYVSDE